MTTEPTVTTIASTTAVAPAPQAAPRLAGAAVKRPQRLRRSARRSRSQRARRDGEQAARRRAAALARASRLQGGTVRATAVSLGVAERTLFDWRRKSERGPARAPLRGRPPRIHAAAARNEVIEVIACLGPWIGVRTLRDFFPDFPRAELADILERFRDVWLRRGAVLRHELCWQGAGCVWALDFTQPASRIDGRYPYILSIRELASGEPILWEPVDAQTTEVAIAGVLRAIDLRTAPLVLKADLGSAFRSDDFHAFLRSRGIVAPHSPARTPRYNGACESGIRHLKLQTRHAAALEGGDPDRPWTAADLERALARAQDFHEARNGGVPGSSVDPDLRQRFALRLAQETDNARDELGLPSDRPPGIMDALRLSRIATRRTLVALGILSFKRRRITLPFRSIFSAKIM